MAPYVSVHNALNGTIGATIVFQNANVNVRSASYEGDTSGTGNLIVGWDDSGTGSRTGSDNLVCGDWNSFPTWGCFVAGEYNSVGGVCASVSGGEQNSASDQGASVSGGLWNTASGSCASVSGGEDNNASADISTVGGWEGITESTMYGWSAGGTCHTP